MTKNKFKEIRNIKYTNLLCCSFIIIYFYLISIENKNINISSLYKINNISICLFLPSAIDDFPFVQGIINSIDVFWPKNVGKKIHWIDNYYGLLPFNYSKDWTIVRASSPNISVPVMKQQYNSYVSYKYCSPNEFIAMIDSDSPFISYAKYNMLFDKNKRPYILYTLKYRDNRWDPRKILKSNNRNWGDVMFTYPIIVKTKHVEETYKYIEKIQNSTLEKIMEKFIFGQFGTFLEYIHIMKYEKQYSLINIEKNPFPPRCTIHLPYSSVRVNFGNIHRITVRKHKNVSQMNVVINYLIEQGECFVKRNKCKRFDKKSYQINSFTVEERYKHFYSNLIKQKM